MRAKNFQIFIVSQFDYQLEFFFNPQFKKPPVFRTFVYTSAFLVIPVLVFSVFNGLVNPNQSCNDRFFSEVFVSHEIISISFSESSNCKVFYQLLTNIASMEDSIATPIF